MCALLRLVLHHLLFMQRTVAIGVPCRCLEDVVHLSIVSSLRCRIAQKVKRGACLWVSAEDENLIRTASQELVPFLKDVLRHREEWMAHGFSVGLISTGLVVSDVKEPSTVTLQVAGSMNGVTLQSMHMCALRSP